MNPLPHLRDPRRRFRTSPSQTHTTPLPAHQPALLALAQRRNSPLDRELCSSLHPQRRTVTPPVSRNDPRQIPIA